MGLLRFLFGPTAEDCNRLVARIDRMIELNDRAGIGNVMLDVLLRSGQDRRPDRMTLALEKQLPRIVSRVYRIPDDYTYHCPFRANQLKHEDRGNWVKDRFVQLMIMAFAFGANRRNLPRPHDALYEYFRRMGSDQSIYLQGASDQFAREHGPYIATPTPPEPPRSTRSAIEKVLAIAQSQLQQIDKEIVAVSRMDEDPSLIEEEVARLKLKRAEIGAEIDELKQALKSAG